MSSRKGTANAHRPLRRSFTTLWNVVSMFFIPNIILVNSNILTGVIKVVFSEAPVVKGICDCPLLMSMIVREPCSLYAYLALTLGIM